MNRFQTLLIAIIATAATCLSSASAATKVVLREQAEISSPVVRLGDVAEVAGGDEQITNRLTQLPLLPGPAADGQRFLRRREIEDLLTAHGFDLRELAIEGAQQVTVSRAARPAILNRHAALLAGHVESRPATTIDANEAAIINDGLRTLIANYLGTKVADAGKWTIECEVAERHLTMLAAAQSRPVCEGGTEPWFGKQRFTVVFTTATGKVRIPVKAEVTAPSMLKPVAFALRAIARGETFTAANVELREFDSSPAANQQRIACDSIDTLIGMEARQAIPAGSVVYQELVKSPVLVKRGELITVSSQSGGIRVRTSARALQDCSHGELVQLESLQTKEKFEARVVGLREAAIATITRPEARNPYPIGTAQR